MSLSEAREVLSCDAYEAITYIDDTYNLLLCDDQFAYKLDLQPGS